MPRFNLGMLISGNSHSRVESRSSRVSIETLDFTREHTFYGCDRSWVAGEGMKHGGGGPVATLDSRKSRNSFPGIKKKDRDSRLLSLFNIPHLIAVMGSRQRLVVESSNLTAF